MELKPKSQKAIPWSLGILKNKLDIPEDTIKKVLDYVWLETRHKFSDSKTNTIEASGLCVFRTTAKSLLDSYIKTHNEETKLAVQGKLANMEEIYPQKIGKGSRERLERYRQEPRWTTPINELEDERTEGISEFDTESNEESPESN